MKKIAIFVLFLISVTTIAQDADTSEIDKLTQNMFEAMNDRNYDYLLDMTYPTVYEYLPKESFKSVFQSMFEGNEEFSIDIPQDIPEYSISKIVSDDSLKMDYAFTSYDMKMSMTFHNQEFDEDQQQMMKGAMESQGMEVAFDSKSKIKMLLPDRVIIFIRNEVTENTWKMINYDPDSPLLYQVLPSSLIEKAKEHRQDLLLNSKKSKEN